MAHRCVVRTVAKGVRRQGKIGWAAEGGGCVFYHRNLLAVGPLLSRLDSKSVRQKKSWVGFSMGRLPCHSPSLEYAPRGAPIWEEKMRKFNNYTAYVPNCTHLINNHRENLCQQKIAHLVGVKHRNSYLTFAMTKFRETKGLDPLPEFYVSSHPKKTHW